MKALYSHHLFPLNRLGCHDIGENLKGVLLVKDYLATLIRSISRNTDFQAIEITGEGFERLLPGGDG